MQGRKSTAPPTQKCHAPLAAAESPRFFGILPRRYSTVKCKQAVWQYPVQVLFEPRFLTNLSHENIYAVNIFMRLNEFSSVRLISIVRTCLKGLYAMPTGKCSVYPSINTSTNQDLTSNCHLHCEVAVFCCLIILQQ